MSQKDSCHTRTHATRAEGTILKLVIKVIDNGHVWEGWDNAGGVGQNSRRGTNLGRGTTLA